MRLRARLQKLERAGALGRGCPACRRRRGRVALLVRHPDGTSAYPAGAPQPCARCGAVPELIIEVIEKVVTTRAQADYWLSRNAADAAAAPHPESRP